MFLDYFSDKEPSVILKGDEPLFKEGDNGDSAYIVQTGHVDLTVKGQALTTIEESEMFGEMALIDNEVRFATATAGPSGATLYSIDQPVFIEMVRVDPRFALDVMKLMTERLRLWGEFFND